MNKSFAEINKHNCVHISNQHEPFKSKQKKIINKYDHESRRIIEKNIIVWKLKYQNIKPHVISCTDVENEFWKTLRNVYFLIKIMHKKKKIITALCLK